MHDANFCAVYAANAETALLHDVTIPMTALAKILIHINFGFLSQINCFSYVFNIKNCLRVSEINILYKHSLCD